MPPSCRGRGIACGGGIVPAPLFARQKSSLVTIPPLRIRSAPSLAAARSHSRSDSRLGCHSIRSCRFATSARGRLTKVCRAEGGNQFCILHLLCADLKGKRRHTRHRPTGASSLPSKKENGDSSSASCSTRHLLPQEKANEGLPRIVGTGVLFKAPSGRELPTESGEGERDRQSWIKAELTQAPSVVF